MSDTLSSPAKVCTDCLTGSIMTGTPLGSMQKLANLDCYVANPAADSASQLSTKAVVLCCDIFGLGIVNPKLMAEKLARELGMVVYVPDLLQGDYASASKLALVEEPIAHESFLSRFSKMGKMIGSFMLHVGPLFLYRHRPAVTVGLASKFCAALRAEKGITRIGAVGYCLGGVQVTLLASVPNAIDVVIVVHPGPLSVKDFEAIPSDTPVGLIAAQEDMSFDGIKDQVVKGLQARGELSEQRTYPGTAHGFAARPLLSNPVIKQAFEDATQFTIDFFKKHL